VNIAEFEARAEIHAREFAEDPIVPCVECGKDVGEHDVEIIGEGFVCVNCDESGEDDEKSD
jgi:hypothetical protein